MRKAEAPVQRRINWSASTEIRETRRARESMLTYRGEMSEVYESLGAGAGQLRGWL